MYNCPAGCRGRMRVVWSWLRTSLSWDALQTPGSRPRCALRFLSALLVVLVAALTDCFGAQSRSDQLSIDAWNRLTAPWYATASLAARATPRSRRGRDIEPGPAELTTVLLDDAFLSREGRSWPLPYAAHAEILGRIARFQPRAIFLDFLFLHPHQGDDSLPLLVDTLQWLDEQHLPVLVAAPNPCLPPTAALADGSPELRPGLGVMDAVTAVATPVIVEWESYGELYPLAFAPRSFAEEAPRAARCAEAEAEGPWRSVALSLFEAACRNGNSATGCRAWRAEPRAAPPPMLVRWGARVPPDDEAAESDPSCEGLDFSRNDKARWSLRVLRADLFRGFTHDEPRFQSCPFIDTLSLSELFLRDPETGHDWTPEEVEHELRALLHDRVVLVGSGLAQSNDKTVSPVHGEVPGVYEHAMALDNLLTYGPDYYEQSLDLASPETSMEIILSIVFLACLMGIGRRLELRAHDEAGVSPTWRARLGFVSKWLLRFGAFYLGFMLATALMVLALSMWLNRSPSNWIGLFSLFTAASPFGLSVVALVQALRNKPSEASHDRQPSNDTEAEPAPEADRDGASGESASPEAGAPSSSEAPPESLDPERAPAERGEAGDGSRDRRQSAQES